MSELARWVAVAIVAASVVGGQADARPRGVPKPIDHYTFSPDRLEDRIRPLSIDYPRVILRNELHIRVSEGHGLCRLEWRGHRIDAITNETDTWSMRVPMPRGSAVDKLTAYLIDGNGRDGHRVKSPAFETEGDSVLVVSLSDIGDARVVELVYEFDGEGVSVDESFLFQPDVPVLSAQYRFSVSRDLWQAAVNAGLNWEFTATTNPSQWGPTRDDTPDYYNWYWRAVDILPVDQQNIVRDPRHVAVTGYLPAPALAAFDPDELPDIRRFDDIRNLEAILRSVADDAYSGGASSRIDPSSAMGTPDNLTPVGK